MNKTSLTSLLSDIACAIRVKTGKNQPIAALSMPDEITSIKTIGLFQQKNVTPSNEIQAVTADTGYDGLSKVTVLPMQLFGSTFKCGTFTLSQKQEQYTLTHNLGRIPENILVTAVTVSALNDYFSPVISRSTCKTSIGGFSATTICDCNIKASNPTGLIADLVLESRCVSNGTYFSDVTAESLTISPPVDSPLGNGITYVWTIW